MKSLKRFSIAGLLLMSATSCTLKSQIPEKDFYEKVLAMDYEKEGYDSDKLEVFWISVQDRIKTPIIRNLFELLKNKRKLIS